MKKIVVSSLLSIFTLLTYSQVTPSSSYPVIPGKTVPFDGEKCASHYMDEFLKRFDPAYSLNRQMIEQHTQHVLQNSSVSRSGGVNRGVVYTVPIVFHVLHEGEAVGDSTNISDAQIYSCIAALNRDFRRNSDDGGIAQSGPLGADAEIEFCLARRDPSGNFTTGITRHDMSGVQGYLDSGVYHSGTWRSDASMKAMVQWNPAQYINVWVVNKIKSTTNIYQGGGGGVIGYATFPGGSAASDGVVIRFSATGNDISGTKGYNLWSATNDNRVLTHEMGHYFNLYHTFHNTSSCTVATPCATSGDLCCDTPPTTVGTGNACVTLACPLDNKENYMQYQNGACASDFTPNQVSRMRAVLVPGGARHALTTNQNCSSPYQINPTLASVFYPEDTVCSNLIPGFAVVCNGGNDTLTSFQVNYDIDGGISNVHFWTGKIGPFECDTIALPALATTAGPHTYNVRVDSTLINGTLNDGFPGNNLMSKGFVSKSGFAVLVDINTDCSAQEISWLIRDTNGTVKLSGSGYTQQVQNIFETACLDSGCFEFVIYDSWGDGLQGKGFCSTNGNFRVTDAGTGQVISKSINPNFGDSLVTSFCLPYNTVLVPGFTGCDTVYPSYPVYLMDTSISFPAAYKWDWDFGDGTTSVQKNPVKSYSTVGTYNVKLVLENAASKDSITQAGCVVVIPTPPGFCDTLYNYDRVLDSMIFYKLLGTWGYYPGHNGANITGYAEPFTLTGATNSVQRVVLPVVQADAGTANSSFVINIYDDNAGTPGTVLSSDTIRINSLVAGVSNEVYLTTPPFITGNFWAGIELDYGNGDTLIITTANNRIGGTNTTFVKTGGIWQSSTGVAAINTSMGIRVIYTDLPATGTLNVSRNRLCQGQTTNFSATGLANYDSLKWFFPGGTPSFSTNTNQSVTYSTPGTYRAILYLEGICSNDSLITTIKVDTAGATASFTESSLAICEQDSVSFDGTVNGNGTIYWTYPTGIPSLSNQEDNTVFFATPGVYPIKMKVDNGCGADSVTKTLTVRGYPNTSISPTDTTICDGSSIALTINGGTGFSWSTGGSTQTISVAPSTTTRYWGVGSNANCVGDTAYVTITNNPIPNVVANANPTLVCLGSAIYFSMTGSNAITYDWDYGDGTTSSTPNASHIYSIPGTYTATVKGTYGLCDSSASIQVIVNDCTGLEEDNLASSIVVYPNPANRFLNISILETNMEQVTMAIFNSSGKMVHSSVINPKTEQTTIDVNEFSEGVYLIRFNAENKVVTKKLIIVK